MLTSPSFDLQIADLLLLLSAMVSLLVFIWASKRLLFLMQISDTGIALSIKKDEKKARARREKNKITNSALKITASNKEMNRRKDLYKLKQLRAKELQSRVKERESISSIQKRLDKKAKYISKGGDKLRTKTGRVITSKPKKEYKTKDFMSKKYRDAVIKGKFNKKRTQRVFNFK